MNLPVVILAGPTASGKSALALDLAKVFPMEIVNADSMQVFRRLDVGTAKPSISDRKAAPHHLYDVLDPDENATAAWYADCAARVIHDVHARGKIPLFSGGSGFYLRAMERPPVAECTTPSEGDSPTADYERLLREDPQAAQKIHPHDRYRIARALSLLERGEKPSDLWHRASSQPDRYGSIWMGLAPERPLLYDRIGRRMSKMFSQGLIEETESILKLFPAAITRVQRAIGYRQALARLNGTMTLDEAIAAAAQATRRYAKRQMTWFRAESRMRWLSNTTPLEDAIGILRGAIP